MTAVIAGGFSVDITAQSLLRMTFESRSDSGGGSPEFVDWVHMQFIDFRTRTAAFAGCESILCRAHTRTIPFPSRTVITWLAFTRPIFSTAPFVHRIVTSAAVSAPSPKCSRGSLAE